MPAVAHPCGSIDGGVGGPANTYRYYLLDGLRKGDGIANPVEPSGVVDCAVGPEPPEQVNRFVEDLPPLPEVPPQVLELPLGPSRTDAENQPSSRELAEGCHLLRDQEGVTLREDQYRGSELHLTGLRRD